MKDKVLPNSLGEEIFPPIQLSNKQEDLCRRLDDFHSYYGLKAKPSDMLRGAVFVSQIRFRSNPDWISQAANSLREILYPFYSREIKNVPTDKEKIFREYGSVKFNNVLIDKIGRIWGSLNGLTHHGSVKKNNIDFTKFTPEDLDKLFYDFEILMLDILSKQTDVHKEIDDILAQTPE